MTPHNKIIADGLFNGHYLLKSLNHAGKIVYKLYDNKRPVIYVHKIDKAIERCLKKDKSDRMTLNYSKIRQLHGSCYLKSKYKLIRNESKRPNETA